MSQPKPPPTVAEKMLSELEKLNLALEELRVKGLPMNFILIYLSKKTHLTQKEILSVLDGLRDLNKEVQPKR